MGWDWYLEQPRPSLLNLGAERAVRASPEANCHDCQASLHMPLEAKPSQTRDLAAVARHTQASELA